MLEYISFGAVHAVTSHQTMALLFLIMLALEMTFVSASSAALIPCREILGSSLVWMALPLSLTIASLAFSVHNQVNSEWRTELALKIP